MVDSTFRWTIVVVLALLIGAAQIQSIYKKGFRPGLLLNGHVGGLALVAIATVFDFILGAPLTDALLLRSRFGLSFANDGIYAYGWGFIFGYALILSSTLAYVVGVIGVKAGFLPRKGPLSEFDSGHGRGH